MNSSDEFLNDESKGLLNEDLVQEPESMPQSQILQSTEIVQETGQETEQEATVQEHGNTLERIQETSSSNEYIENQVKDLEIPNDSEQEQEEESIESSDSESDDDDGIFKSALLFEADQLPAWQMIDNMLEEGLVEKEIATILQEKLQKAHDTLVQFMKQERNLMLVTSKLTQQVANQRLGLDKKGTRQFMENSTLGEKRRQLLKLRNEVHIAKEREESVKDEIQELEKEREDMLRDIMQVQKQKADSLEPQLIQATKNLKAEITQKKSQSDLIQKELEEKEVLLETTLKKKHHHESIRDSIASSLLKTNDIPQKLMKQSDVMKEAIKALTQEDEKLNSMLLDYDKEIERLGNQKKEFEQLKVLKASEYDKKRQEIYEMERQCDEIYRKHENAKEKLSVQKSEQVRISMQLQSITSKIRKDHELSMKAIRERDAYFKDFRRLESVVSNIKTSLPLLERQLDEAKQIRVTMKRDGGDIQGHLDALQREIDISMYEFLTQSDLEKQEMDQVAKIQQDSKENQTKLDLLKKQLNELVRQYEELFSDKQVRQRELIRLSNKYKSIKHDLNLKHEIIADASMECQEAFVQLNNFIKLYEVVKTERNKFLALIQSANQHISEIKEKTKIVTNEIDILRQDATNKDKEVARKEQENANQYGRRDKVKNECNKLLQEHRLKRSRIDENMAQTEKLNMTITVTEQSLVRIREEFTQVTQERNNLAQTILERNDELCVLYEKANEQQNELSSKSRQISEWQEEIKKYEIIEKEFKRDFENLKYKRPLVKRMHRDISKLEREINLTKQKIHQLTLVVENPKEKNRIRELKGKDLDEVQVVQKIQELEQILATKEEKLIERDLVLNEVGSLTEKLRKETLEKRSETTELSGRLNDYAKKIKTVNGSLMAKAAELAMTQAASFNLQNELKEEEEILEKAQRAIEMNSFIVEEFEKDLLRAYRFKIKRERELAELKEKQERTLKLGVDMDQAGFYLYKNVKSKAVPRPTAYMPDVLPGELPIPKSYGAHAPFKPAETKHHLKFYKQQIIDPVEL